MKTPRLKEWRETMGETQVTLGKRSGVAEHTISRIEHGASLRPSTARKLANALGVTVADLMERPPVALKSEAPTGTGPEDLSGVLRRLGSPTQYLADPDLADKLQRVSVSEAVAISRDVVREAAMLGPELERMRDAEPLGSVGYMHANLLLETAGVRRFAVRLALRDKRGAKWVPVAGRDEAQEQLEKEAEELDRALALA